MPVFALSMVHGPGWDDTRPIREQQAWDQHAAFMDGLVDDGFIILGGPLGDGARTLHVVQASGEQEIRTRAWRGSLGVYGPAPDRLDRVMAALARWQAEQTAALTRGKRTTRQGTGPALRCPPLPGVSP